ncbi:Down syndrome cell adhesion molecule-like protein Dscam2 isoform X3 [Limulus polyphemus]|uniref:Down syndrome cell adhesion molecule-like protein Dscam2 isoform X3 n=1 Tax=Limulus polyphemus TaxID=6850 RepID=A0ABM1SAQ2_LIMPO|nr:Down syndrome cell adhesion molecule-like protein Dscam2 isoform X3 [Limulus polyphemus]
MIAILKILGATFGLFFMSSDSLATSELTTTRGPRFLEDHPDVVEFTNTSGVVIPCRADGQPPPIVQWMIGNRNVVRKGKLQEVSSDGSLVFKPFHANDYLSDVHSAKYKCMVTNVAGTIRSKDIRVRAVIVRHFEVQVYNEYVIRGNSAVLKCHVPSHVRDIVTVTSWIQDESIQITSSTLQGGKYSVLPTGSLLIRDVTEKDERKVYRCQVYNRLTSESKVSSKSGRIILTDVHSPISPRLIHSLQTVQGQKGEVLSLPCVAQGNPAPYYQWYRLHGRDKIPLFPGYRFIQHSELLVLEHLSLEDNGTYVCVANNSVGKVEAQTIVFVSAPFKVDLHPHVLTANFGDLVTFGCSVSPTTNTARTLIWFKDGHPLSANTRIMILDKGILNIHSVQREDKGMYQCMVTSDRVSSQDTAELVVREQHPRFHFTFESTVVQPGSTISMKCSASGIPLPQITWTRDGVMVPEVYLTRIGDYVSNRNTVNSYVNISSVSGSDGGIYSCTAENIVGRVTYSARLDVYGPPYIRPMDNITVLAGRSATVQCPFSGFPLKEVFWEKDEKRLPYNHRQRPFPNGTFILEDIQHQDFGWYACGATDGQGRKARQELWINVATPPVVEPLKVSNYLSEGERASVMCVVSAGDLPISIHWKKDGMSLPSDLEASVVMANNYTSILSFPVVRHEHRGNYSCVASNPVASNNFTAALDVKVPPKWKHKPVHQASVVGHKVVFNCQAEGFPSPVARWKKVIGNDGEFRVVISNANIQILENGSLVIQEATPEDSGSYMCQLTNGVGSGLSTVIDLSVHVAVHTEQKFKVYTVKEGDSVTLECRARGENPIEVTWMMDQVPFDPTSSPRYIFKETIEPEGKVSTIKIISISREESGLFVCDVENDYGKDETGFQVVVQDFWNRDSDVIAMEAFRTEYTIQGLLPSSAYKVRMRANNNLGSSDYSDVITVTTDDEPPGERPREVTVSARGSRSIYVTWKQPHQKEKRFNIVGYYVGYRVQHDDPTLPFKTVEIRNHQTHECEIGNLKSSTKYEVIVQAFNEEGAGPTSMPVIVETFEYDPPRAPTLQILSTTSSSIHLTWDKPENENPVDEYSLYHKEEISEWKQIKLPGNIQSHVFHDLRCGRKYEFYMEAQNSAGRGRPSEVITITTDGSAPQAPDKHRLLAVNATSVTVHLSVWRRGGCPLLYFSVQYKPLESTEWILLSNNILPEQTSLTIPDLTPATWYTLLITSSNEAGNTEEEYVFATLTLSGATVSPHYSASSHTSGLYRQLKIIIPVVCTTVVLVLVVTVACVILLRRRQVNPPNCTYSTAIRDSDPGKTETGEAVPMTVWDKRNQSDPRLHHSRDQLYFPSPYATSRLSVYSGEGDVEGGGTPSWNSQSDPRLRHSREQLPYPNTYAPSGTSVNSDDLQTDRGINFSWGQLTSENGFHTYDIPIRRKPVSQNQSFKEEQGHSKVKNKGQHVYLNPVGIASRSSKDIGIEFTNDLATHESYTPPETVSTGSGTERHYDQIKRPKHHLSRSLQKKFSDGRTGENGQRKIDTGEERCDFSDAECDRYWSRVYLGQES